MSAVLRPPRVSRERFEQLYAASDDPWDYRTSEYERQKYADTLAALPERALGEVLEVGCSIGVFSQLLAPCCRRLVAIDFSARAVALAREQLTGVANVELAQASFPERVPDGGWDLVVCSEVLYYLDENSFERATRWLRTRLEHGSSVLAVSWRGEGSQEPMRGDEAHDRLIAELGRWHALDVRRPGYRLDRFDADVR